MYINVKIRLVKQVLDTPPGGYRRDVIEVRSFGHYLDLWSAVLGFLLGTCFMR
jgi:hypothetical protein